MIKLNDQGLTLLEVLLSLIMASVIVAMVLNLYLPQYRLLKETMIKAEVQFSLLRAGQVLTAAISTAHTVNWNANTLEITSVREGTATKDYFYLADKDHNGIVDLYREHLGVPNPIVSGLQEIKAVQNEKGLWTVTVIAGSSSEAHILQKKVRQRIWPD